MKSKKFKILYLSTIASTAIVITSMLVISCSANYSSPSSIIKNNDNAIDNYIEKINSAKYKANEKGSLILPNDSVINNSTLQNYLANFDEPSSTSGITIQFKIISSNINKGSLVFQIIATYSNSSLTSNELTATGFLIQPISLQQYIQKINSTEFTVNPQGSLILPSNSQITDSTLKNYLSNFPEPNSISDISIKFKIDSSNDNNGTLDFQIIATYEDDILISKIVKATGFLNSELFNAKQFFNSLKNVIVNANKIGEKIIPSEDTITSGNFQNLVEGLPRIPSDLKLDFKIISANPLKGEVSFEVVYLLGGVLALNSNQITAAGFSTYQNFLEQYIQKVNEAEYKANDKGSLILPNNSIVTDSTLQNYLANFDKPSSTSKITIQFKIISSNINNGSLVFQIIANYEENSLTSNELTATGFLTNGQVELQHFINEFNKSNLAANDSGQKLSANSSSINADNIINFINGIPQLVPKNINLKFEINNINEKDGSITLTLVASLGGHSLTSNQITVSGFLKINEDIQSSINNYIDEINKKEFQLNSSTKDVSPSDINSNNISQYINFPATPSGVSLSYEIESNNSNGDIYITVTATGENDIYKKSSNNLTIRGFKVIPTQTITQNALNLTSTGFPPSNSATPNELGSRGTNTITATTVNIDQNNGIPTNFTTYAQLKPYVSLTNSNPNVLITDSTQISVGTFINKSATAPASQTISLGILGSVTYQIIEANNNVSYKWVFHPLIINSLSSLSEYISNLKGTVPQKIFDISEQNNNDLYLFFSPVNGQSSIFGGNGLGPDYLTNQIHQYIYFAKKNSDYLAGALIVTYNKLVIHDHEYIVLL